MIWRLKPYELTAAYCQMAGRVVEQQMRLAKVALDSALRSQRALAGMAPAPSGQSDLTGSDSAGPKAAGKTAPTRSGASEA